jgi:hypothetical protein
MVKTFLLSLLLICGYFKSPAPHPLYVSITDLEWNAKEKSIEIVSKIFLDDFESILKTNYNKKIDLYATPNEMNKGLIFDYFKKHLQITIDGKLYAFNIIGYERQKEACWCYLEITGVASVKKVSVTNSLLHDFSEKQINLIHVRVNDKEKSNKLSYPSTSAIFEF